MKKLLVILFIAGVLLLFACSQPPILFGGVRATVSSTTNVLVLNNKNDPWNLEAGERNDGKISLKISDVSGECHSLGQPIQIRMTFHNLTNDTLTIPGIFKIFTNSYGAVDIIAAMKPADKREIYAAIESNGEVDIVSRIPTPYAYYELPANGILEKIVEYHIRHEIFVYESKKDEYYFFSVGPGHYFLDFGYTLSDFDFRGNRKNRVGFAVSNRLEICLK